MRRFLFLRSLINNDAIVDARRKLDWTWGQYPSPPPIIQDQGKPLALFLTKQRLVRAFGRGETKNDL